MQKITIGSNQAGQRLDKFLHKYLPNAGTSFLFKMLRKKNITLNGKKAQGNEILSEGDTVESFFSEETFKQFQGSDYEDSSVNNAIPHSNLEKQNEYQKAYQSIHDIQIIYEDDNVLILNKPVGVLSQKAEAKDISANEWLIGYLLNQGDLTNEELKTFKPSVCNRLDRNTSGLLLCGKSLAGSQKLSKDLKERSVHKYYRTVCVGELTIEQTIQGYLIKDEKSNKVTIVEEVPRNCPNPKDYSPITTTYKPLKVCNNFTLLEIELVTGKPHQIRAHLASIKHPIIGDTKYGYDKINQAMQKQFSLKNQLLHAYCVAFETEDGALSKLSSKKITAPLPKQFIRIATQLNLIE